MACFIVPLTQAIATSAYRKLNENRIEESDSALMHNLPALEKMLWGGSVLLVVDHILSGELTWRFPFLTALDGAQGVQIVLRELLTVGLPMSLVLTAVWAVWAILKKKSYSLSSPEGTRAR